MHAPKILAILLATMVMFSAAAEAKNCYYNGKAYSDGARNEIGQVCDGQTGSWK
jgi:hypothetical protein